MQVNADFSQRAVVHAARLPWTPSPIAGVDRRMLDRIGDEVARATSIVRYAPDSHFAPHTHGGGEEFLVLDGVFQDEHGDYPVSTYVRNPPTTRHSPGSTTGCVIFVKLWQFEPGDRTPVRIDTAGQRGRAIPDRAGVEVVPLFEDGRENVRLERWAPGAFVSLRLPGGGEFLVLEGGFSEAGEDLEPQSWLRLPPGGVLRAVAGSRGGRLWVKTGHLAEAPAAPRGHDKGPDQASSV